MELDLTIRLGQLLDIYGGLLTEKQVDVLSMYVNDNMSYQEIAEVLGISKPAVLDFIRSAERKLEEFESKVGVLGLRNKLNQIAKGNNVKQDLISLLKEL